MKISQYIKPISISLSPNVQTDDTFLAAKLLLKMVGVRKRGAAGGEVASEASLKLEQKFREYLGAKYAFSFNSGRSALFTILKVLDIKDDDEVLLQTFTCNAVPNPVLWVGGKPVYVDIDESLNIDPIDLERKITPNSRAIIVQHTFGVPAKIDTILEIARRHKLIVIEDCAHALGANYNGRPVGTFGDVAFFSFGRDKIISSVWGGMVTTNNEGIAKRIESLHASLPIPSKSWALRQILHPILFSIIIPTYYLFGKYFLILLKAARGVGLAVSQKERLGQKPDMFPARMPNALAIIALHQFEKLERYNEHRKEIARTYVDLLKSDFNRSVESVEIGFQQIKNGAIYLRFNITHPKAREIIKNAKKKHILLGDWYSNVIDPKGTDFEKMKYIHGSCPNAEKIAEESINLPTHINISTKDAKRIVQYLRNYK